VTSSPADIGDDHFLSFFGWCPDRELNPQYDGIPDVPKAGATIDHRKPDGSLCTGAITFDTPSTRQVFPEAALWQVEAWEPLTISPSVLCSCGDHGYIRGGRWVPA
jgi:hypothetical protein